MFSGSIKLEDRSEMGEYTPPQFEGSIHFICKALHERLGFFLYR